MKKPSFKTIGALLVWFISLLVYIFSASRTNPGYADSDELITVGYLLGSAHPSGYPLMVVLIKLFTLLPIPGTIAFRANILNSLLHSLTVLAIYLIGLELTRLLPLDNDKKGKESNQLLPTLIAATGSLFLGFSAMFWLYAGVTEVGPLNDLLGAAAILTTLYWRKFALADSKATFKELLCFFLTAILIGIGVSHVHVFVLLLPGFAVALLLTFLEKKVWSKYGVIKLIAAAVLGFGAFLGVNLILFWLNSHQANVSWYFPQTWSGWWGQVTRKVYTGFIPEKNVQGAAYLGGFIFSKFINNIPIYWYYLNQHFSYLGAFIGLGGAAYLFKRNWKLGTILATWFLCSGFFIGIYMTMPENDPNNLEYRSAIGVAHRQYLLGETVWGIFIILGLWAGLNLLWRYFKNNTVNAILVVSLTGVLLISWAVYDNYSIGVQRNNRHAWNYAKQVLESVPKDSVLVCFADFSCFSMMYMQEVEGVRPDVSLVTKNIYIKHYYVQRHPELYYLVGTDNPYFSADIISWNLYKGRPVFLSDAVGFYISFIGMEGDPFFLIPKGYLFQVVDKVPNKVGTFDYQISKELLSDKKSPKDFWRNGQQDYFSNFHTLTAMIYSYLNDKADARTNFKLALSLKDDYKNARDLYASLAGYEGNPEYRLGQESSSSAQLLEAGQSILKLGDLDEAYQKILKATLRNPESLEARIELAELYTRGGYYDEALMEYQNILRHDPNNQQIKQTIEELKKKVALFAN
ncbi:DUF2723 domain-containing protein [Candidatus Beckwithbacteria bacterium]|nr:DUF2723 domain-containing protein [Candidatus Beckwithbacteria bacterium]